jgi:hypothetical protein
MKRTAVLSITALLATAASLSAGLLPSAPPGQTWQYVSTNSYTDSDAGSLILNASGNFSTPSVTPIGVSLSLTTFNENSAPSGQFYCVTASTFSTSLLASTNVTLFNFSGLDDSFYGALSLAGLSIGGSSGASAGPVTSSVSRLPGNAQPVTAFDVTSFLDFATGASSTNVNLTDSGPVATNNGAPITFSFSGNSVAVIRSTGAYTGPLWTASGAASYNASLTTFYDVYELVAIVPEPGAALLGGMALLGMSIRRRR